MGDENVTRFPVKSWERTRNKRGKGSVSCYVTDRYLKFSKQEKPEPFGTPVWIDVFSDANGNDRKMARLCVTLEQLEAAMEFAKTGK